MADGVRKHCSATNCARSILVASATTDGQRRELEGYGWFPMARKGGKLAVFCPAHKPAGTPSSMGRSTP